MTILEEIIPQPAIDELCAEFRRFDNHLASPKYGLPDSFSKYWKETNGQRQWMMTKYFRNIAALDKFEAFIETLNPFFISVEYFQGAVTLERKAIPWHDEFTDQLFLSILSDSLRSSLDIFAKSLAWFFSLPGKEDAGFGYKTLIIPLRELSRPIADGCNSLLQSEDFKFIKEFRDANKHIGQGKNTITMKGNNGGFTIETKRPEPLNIIEFKSSAAALFNQMQHLVRLSVDELLKWPLGYDAPGDLIANENPDGTLRVPPPK